MRDDNKYPGLDVQPLEGMDTDESRSKKETQKQTKQTKKTKQAKQTQYPGLDVQSIEDESTSKPIVSMPTQPQSSIQQPGVHPSMAMETFKNAIGGQPLELLKGAIAGGEGLKNVVSSVPKFLFNTLSDAGGTVSGLYHHPLDTLGNFLKGAGHNLYEIPQNVAHGIVPALNLHQQIGKVYPDWHPQGSDSPGFKLGNVLSSFIPVSRLAKLADTLSATHLAPLVGKEASQIAGLTAGGAGAALTQGQSPSEGAVANLLFHGLGAGNAARINKANAMDRAFQEVAPTPFNALSDTNQKLYKVAARNKMNLRNNASRIFDSLDNDSDAQQTLRNPTNSFFDAVDKNIKELRKNPGRDEQEVAQWLEGFRPKEKYTNVSGKKVSKPDSQGIDLSSFADFKNAYQKLNEAYKTKNVDNIPLYKAKVRELKDALNQNLEEMGDTLPSHLKPQFEQANHLWRQQAEFDKLPNTRKTSPFALQFNKELYPNKVANGEFDENGDIVGNPGNFVSNSLIAEGPGKTSSAKINHLIRITGPEYLPDIRSAYLNPKGEQDIKMTDLEKRLNTLSTASKKALFQDNPAMFDRLKSAVEKGQKNKVKDLLETGMGVALGMKFGHGLLGGLLGHHLANIKKNMVHPPGVVDLAPESEANAIRRRNLYLPATTQDNQ